MKLVLVLISVVLFCSRAFADELPLYKICVPKLVHEHCLEFLEKPPSNVAEVKCVTGRDRMDCLEKVHKREADFLFVDPEDMYVAYHINNKDFSVFAELRSTDEPLAEFRYEGVILVRKGSEINSMADLKNKTACHTGYGRNVGYKIPITKLKKNGVLKVSTDQTLPPNEKELKALSEFFSKACIVGNWSPNPEINIEMKKRYSNLCDMCEDPKKCDYPDKYSGYDGAIRCLDQNNGDVAFTKTIWVKKYFGLPIGNGNTSPVETAQGKVDNFEYLCENGSRRPITGSACSWAQRPWQGYMGNADVNTRLKNLQERIENFYSAGKESPKSKEAKKININRDYLVVAKDTPVSPGDHLDRAGYKDVIERDGSITQKIRFCVASNIELKKCDVMKQAAYSREIRPDFMCILNSKEDCIHAVQNNDADIVAVTPKDYAIARDAQLKEILYELFDDDDVYVVVVPKGVDKSVIQNGAVKFDSSKLRSVNAALYLLEKLDKKKCPSDIVSDDSSVVEIVRSTDLEKLDANKFELLCPDLSTNTLDNFKTCNVEFILPTAIYSRIGLSNYELQNIIQAFTLLSKNFGHGARNEEVFELFGEFEEGQQDVIFDDNASKFVTAAEYKPAVDEKHYKEIRCH